MREKEGRQRKIGVVNISLWTWGISFLYGFVDPLPYPELYIAGPEQAATRVSTPSITLARGNVLTSNLLQKATPLGTPRA